jgi:hypothetical protein
MNRMATMRSSWLSHGLIGCAGVVIGAVSVPFWGQHPPIDQTPGPQASRGAPLVETHVDTEAIDSRIRQVIREELARHDANEAPVPVPVPVPVPAGPPPANASVASAEIVAQTARANAVLDAATTRLSWTDEDASEFRGVIAALPAAERQMLMLKFAQAVNDRGMRLETGGAPF